MMETLALLTDLMPVAAAPFVGSFLATAAVRAAAARSVVRGRSACPACGQALAPWDLVPVLSWLAARGRCRHCRARVSVFYPVVELAAFSIAVWAALWRDGPDLWIACGLGWLLLVLAVIDWRERLLPDALTLSLGIFGLFIAAADRRIVDAAIGAAVGLVAFAAVRWLYARLRRREGLGLGDVKLIAAAGTWVGWAGLPSVVLIASVAALAVVGVGAAGGRRARADDAVPFGSFLAFGCWLVWLHGPLRFGSA